MARWQQGRSETVDLNDADLVVDISDALSERDKVKFTVHTRVSTDVSPVCHSAPW